MTNFSVREISLHIGRMQTDIILNGASNYTPKVKRSLGRLRTRTTSVDTNRLLIRDQTSLAETETGC